MILLNTTVVISFAYNCWLSATKSVMLVKHYVSYLTGFLHAFTDIINSINTAF